MATKPGKKKAKVISKKDMKRTKGGIGSQSSGAGAGKIKMGGDGGITDGTVNTFTGSTITGNLRG